MVSLAKVWDSAPHICMQPVCWWHGIAGRTASWTEVKGQCDWVSLWNKHPLVRDEDEPSNSKTPAFVWRVNGWALLGGQDTLRMDKYFWLSTLIWRELAIYLETNIRLNPAIVIMMMMITSIWLRNKEIASLKFRQQLLGGFPANICTMFTWQLKKLLLLPYLTKSVYSILCSF